MKKFLMTLAAAALAVPAMFSQGFVSQNGNMYPLEMIDNNTMTFSGTVEVQPMEPFTFLVNLGPGGAMPCGPTTDVYISAEDLSSGITGDISIGSEGEFYLMAGAPMALDITFDIMDESKYSIKAGNSGDIKEPVIVTFNITGIANGWESLTLPEGLTGPTYATQITNPGSQIYFQIPEDSDYKIQNMTVSNMTEDKTKVMLDNVGNGAWQAAIMYDESLNGMEIDVEIVGVNNTTFNFTGMENAYEEVLLYNFDYDDQPELTSNSYVFNYASSGIVALMANDGYVIDIPEASDNSYQVEGIDLNGSKQYSIQVLPAANGKTIEVKVSKAQELSKVTFNFTGIDKAFEYVNVYDPAKEGYINLTGNTYSYEYQGTGGLSFSAKEGYELNITCTNDNDPEAEAPYSIQGVAQEEGGIQYTVSLAEGANGLEFDVNVSLATTTVTEKVTFEFTGLDNAYEYVNAYELDGVGVITLAGDTYTYEFAKAGGLSFSAKEGYELNITCTNYSGSEDAAPFSINSIAQEEGAAQWTVSLAEGAEGLNFNVAVYPVRNYKVSFSFTGVENAMKQVTIFSGPEEGNGLIILDTANNSLEYEYAEQGLLVISPLEGYDIDITCVTENGEGYSINGTVADDLIQYNIGLTPDANGLSFVVDVYEVANVDNAVTFNFTGITDAYKYVTVYDMEDGGEGTVELSSNNFTYHYNYVGGVTIAPKEGYVVTVECTNYNGEGIAPFHIDGVVTEDVTQYVVGLLPNANGLSFDVNVSIEAPSAVSAILNAEGPSAVYNINGTKVMDANNASDLNNLAKGIYIINGKKVLINK